MIRVLVVDDQNFVRQSLTTLLEQRPDIEVVGTAADGQAAIEQVEALHPDVVLIDLSMPVMDGTTAIQNMAERFGDTKVLVLSGHEDNASVSKALRAGAKGYLLKGASEEDLAIAVQAVYRGYAYLGPGLLEKTMSSSAPLVSTALPTTRLQNWTYWIANEVVSQWRQQQFEALPSVDTVVSDLGLTSSEGMAPLLNALGRTPADTSVSLELTQHFRLLQQEQQQHKLLNVALYEWLEQKTADLSKWFGSTSAQPLADTEGCIAELQTHAQDVQTQMLGKLQAHFAELLSKAGSLALLRWLEDLEKKLQDIQADYETQQQECLHQENSAWRAYNTLGARLTDPNWQKPASPSTDQAPPLRALSLAYGFKLKAEIYALGSQQIRGLLPQVQERINRVQKTDALLASWQDCFTKRCSSMQSVFLPLLSLSLVEQVNPTDLRYELENQVGLPLNRWGETRSDQGETLRDQLLEQLQQLTMSLYLECCHTALSLNDPSATLQTAAEEQLQPSDPPLAVISPQFSESPESKLEIPTAQERAEDNHLTFQFVEVVDSSGTILSSSVSVFDELESELENMEQRHWNNGNLDHHEA
jgi:DNA-binding NarL/FixJ family response regulator